MKVVLKKNIRKLGHIGEIVEVKSGYARNCLMPQGLAVAPTEANVKAIEAEKAAYLAELEQQKAQLQAQATLLEGKEFTISARANEEGHLYGSIGPAQVASVVVKGGHAVESEWIVLDEPIRKLDKYEVKVEYAEGVAAKIVLWVVPLHEEGAAPAPQAEEAPAETPPTEQNAEQAN